MQKTILITGASSGMGKAATKLFAQRGWLVFAGARRVEKIPTGKNIQPLKLDVTDHESNSHFVATAMLKQSRLDVLLNNAGYGEFGPLEEVTLDSARQQLETNLIGVADLSQLVLPMMRKQGYGRIINNSSIGGDMYTPLGGWYYVSKHALNVWSETLDSEIRQFGLRSLIIEPGDTQSAWTSIAMDHAQKNTAGDSPYRPLVNGVGRLLANSSSHAGATSEQLAEVFLKAATDKHPKRRYFYSFGDQVMAHFARVHTSLFGQAIDLGTKLVIKSGLKSPEEKLDSSHM